MKFILGKKVGMTTIYHAEKGAQNVTLVDCAPNVVTQIRTVEKDGYSAVQIGLRKFATKGNNNFLKVKEFRLEAGEKKTGDELSISQFKIGDKVKVSGITKAKGFQGVVKRHGFKGAPKTHGHKHDLRAPGSIGSSFPEHVMKGKRMAGRMGGARMSVRNLEIVEIDEKENLIFLKGAVPGVKGRMIEITSLSKD